MFILDKESSSGEEYQNDEEEDDDDDEYANDNDDDSVEDLGPKNRRSSAAKRKSIAILSKDKTERWGNYRNTIDNGPVPRIFIVKEGKRTIRTHLYFLEHALTLNEIAFDVALKFQQNNQNQQLTIEYLDTDNKIEFVNDTKLHEQIRKEAQPIQLSSNVS